MPQHFSSAHPRCGAFCAFLPFAAFLILFFGVVPIRAASGPDPVIQTSGVLPRQGRLVIRSALAWLDENAALFHTVASVVRTEAAARGLSIVARPPSRLEPMPKTPLPEQKDAASASPSLSERNKGTDENRSAQKAAELAKDGKLPKLKLRGYDTPEKDRDLPDSVKSITAPDVARALFARSQQQGLPIVRSFSIPGRMPKELADDAKLADYAMLVRFASVRAWAAGPRIQPVPAPFSWPPGVLVAASSVKGVGALGFGTPAQPAPPGSTYGTPGGYVRGYEGSSPNDFWNRDSDFLQRDYQFKHGPQPNYATPPSDFSKTPRLPGGSTSPGLTASGFNEWHYLVLECYALAPVAEGREPRVVWRGAGRVPGDTEALGKTLPLLTQRVLAETGDPKR